MVVIDTDAGTDDAWGLFMAIRAHRDPSHPVRIVAITTVHGNTKVENVNKNVTRTLQTAGETGVRYNAFLVNKTLINVRFLQKDPSLRRSGGGSCRSIKLR